MGYLMRNPAYIYIYIYIIPIIIISFCKYAFSESFNTIRLYHLSLQVCLPGYILYPYRDLDKLLLFVLHLRVHVKGSIGERCF